MICRRYLRWVIVGCSFLCITSSGDAEKPSASSTDLDPSHQGCPLSVTDNRPPSDLAPIQALATTASDLFQSLRQTQRSNAIYCVGDAEQHSWTNLPGRRPGGIRLAQLNSQHHKQVWSLMDGFLSDNGYDKIRFLATDIESASGAGTLEDYTIALFGEPAVDAVWGFQFDGHHIGLNFLVDADDVVLSPAFVGSQPTELNGRKSMANEYSTGRDLFRSLGQTQQLKAKLPDLVRRSLFAGSGRGHVDQGRNFNFDSFNQTGLSVSELNDAQRQSLLKIVATYILNLDEAFASKVLDSLTPSLVDGYFVYSVQGDRVYYRVFVDNAILIEYGDVGSDHIHTVTRLLGESPMRDYGGYANRSHPESVLTHLMTSDHHRSN